MVGQETPDFCVVGHVTRDIVRIDGEATEMPGGAAYYASLAMKSLGASVAVVTKVAPEDDYLLDRLRSEGIAVFAGDTGRSTVFENVYPDSLVSRTQRVAAIAAPFTVDDVAGVSAGVYHLGPLTAGDLPLEVIAALAERSPLSLEAQGFLRGVFPGDESVCLTAWPEMAAVLSLVTWLKADEAEAGSLTGEDDPARMAARLAEYGPSEIVVTSGARGSLVWHSGRTYRIAACPVAQPVDPTGCGDTYFAAYLVARRRGLTPEDAGNAGAGAAAAKLAVHGPLPDVTGV